MRSFRHAWWAAGIMLLWQALSPAACTAGPRSEPCRNDGDCPEAEHGNAHCVNHQCVECVTRAACGPHRTCENGACVPD